MKYRNEIIILILLPVIIACTSQVEENHTSSSASNTDQNMPYGEVSCEFAGSPVETVRYGGKITLVDGEELYFMSVECLAGYRLGMPDPDDVVEMQAVDFVDGKRLMDVEDLVFLHSKLRPSPNGLFLSAVDASNEKMKTFVYDAYPGPYLSWDEVLALVQKEWEDTTETARK